MELSQMQGAHRIQSIIGRLVQRLDGKITQLITVLVYRPLFAIIGTRSMIYKPLRLINPQNIFIGDQVRIYKQARIEAIERWGKISYTPQIVIGNRVSVEQRLHLTCANRVEIGDDTVISADVMITDLNHSYQEIQKSVMSQPIEVKETIIGKYSFIGMGVRIMAGTKLGDNTIVGSNSVVIGDFPGYVVLAGAPARIVKRYDFAVGRWRKTNIEGEFIDEL